MKIEDKELGIVTLIANARSKRMVARVRDGVLQITYPSRVREKEILSFIDEFRPKLLKLKERSKPAYIFSPQSDLVTFSFTICLQESLLANFYAELKDARLTISYPNKFDSDNEAVQQYVKVVVEKVLRKEARQILSEKVQNLAQSNGFNFTEVKINKSQSRWGSCSSKRSINLSYYCMLLPEHLIDFIILHELCHTIEMNHSDRFWALLDKVSGGKAQEYTKELRGHQTRW